MEYTLAEAAKAAQVNKSTVLRAMKSGRLSSRREEDGTYRIDASELARVYELHHMTRSLDGALPHGAPSDGLDATLGEAVVELAVTRVRVQMLEDQLELRDRERATILETVEDLRKRLDRAEERVLALSAQAAQPAPQMPQERPSEALAVVEATKAPKGFLARLLGL